MIVITLTKVPASLRGDLTKWYQEIQTGVYVGSVSAKIRDLSWERILRDIGQGQATMVYNAQNEFGYQFRTTRKDYEVVDFDGIPLMKHLKVAPVARKSGFSDASKRHMARTMSQKKMQHLPDLVVDDLVAVDVETTGLDVTKDDIISIGAVKVINGDFENFDVLVCIQQEVPKKISELTGISTQMLDNKGIPLKIALEKLEHFIGDLPICGYNFRFDDDFISAGRKLNSMSELTNAKIDLLPVVKKLDQFLDNYRLATVLDSYSIENLEPHHALADAKGTLMLAMKLIKNGDLQI